MSLDFDQLGDNLTYPPLIKYQNKLDCLKHFKSKYCNSVIKTHDGYRVIFTENKFNHIFYKRKKRFMHKKTIFSFDKAMRIDWIETALLDKNATLFAGWDRKNKQYDNTRRVCVVQQNYVVVIRFNSKRSIAYFVTSYIADHYAVQLIINNSPLWS